MLAAAAQVLSLDLSPSLPARSSVSLGRTGTPVPSTSAYSMSGSGPAGGSGTMTRATRPAASAWLAARAFAPVASADRSIVRGLTVIPASPAISPAARAKEASAPARAVISVSPGDSEP